MPWIIDSSPIDNEEKTEGVMSPNYTPDQKLAHKFRLLDDDGEVYYKGRSSDNSSFAPLDDYGMPNAGCTEIQYLNHGKWETL